MKKKIYLIFAAVCFILSLTCIFMFLPKPESAKLAPVREAAKAVIKRGGSYSDQYNCPVDFRSLKTLNEDIYAWLYIPGTEINYPVLQSQDEDQNYYLSHSIDRQDDENGCLFTQSRYNGTDFSDPVTVIYGHRCQTGDLFGSLQRTYIEEGALQKFSDIIIYTPDQELHFQVFGSSEYTKIHILHEFHRFSDVSEISVFLSALKHYHTMSHQFDERVSVTEKDRLLILSTHLSQNQEQRYLVLAKLIEEIS